MKKGVIIFWSIFAAAALFRVWQSFRLSPPGIGPCLKQTVRGIGIILSEPQRTETGQVLIISVEEASFAEAASPAGIGRTQCPSDFLLRVKAKLYPEFSYADQVSFSGKLLEPMNFASGDRTFDYRGYLAKDDIYYEMKSAVVADAAETARTEAAQIADQNGADDRLASFRGTAISSVSSAFRKLSLLLYSLKAAFVRDLERTLGEPHAALAAGLVVGEKAALGKDLLDDFRTVGLIHIVVLSGFNITIVAVAMRRMLSFLPRVWGIVIGGIGIMLFGILVGGGATVVRSCFMAGIALSADLLRRDYSVVRAVALAALIMLIQNPMILLHDASFQLSFLATVGLVMLAAPIERWLQFIPDVFGMRGIVAATVSTQIFVAPFILYLMGQISIIGMIVNILVLPCIPPTMLFVFLTGAAGLVSLAAAQAFGWISYLLLTYEIFIVRTFARIPFAAAHLPPFSAWWVVGLYGVFLIAYLVVKLRNHASDLKSR